MVKVSAAHRLLEVIGLFLKIGTISFGGPVAHIALMEQEAVHKRGWLSREHFLDLLAATNLVPGPNATEMAIHIGFVHAGWPGLIAGGAAFIFPAFLISLALGMVYARFGHLPQSAALFYGINPMVIAIILTATYHLGREVFRDGRSLALGIACLVAALLGVKEAEILLAGGTASALFYAAPRWKKTMWLPISWSPLAMAWPRSANWLADRVVQMGLFFLKVGTLLFGSGMVLFAFIQRDIVTRYGWLTQQQLLDAIAVGQMTPGPVSSAATFIGYLIAGLPGAVVATVAIFFPSFVIVSLSSPWIPRLRQSSAAQAFLHGVNIAVFALILAVTLALFRSAIVDVWTAFVMLAGLMALLRFQADALWLVLGGAIVGFARYLAMSY